MTSQQPGTAAMRHARSGTFQSFFQGGFECSTHRRLDGVRLDIIAATRHDALAEGDYRLAASHGLRTIRDGMRWHLVERVPGAYDWASLLPMVRAARDTGTQVIWDILHYGWPDHLDIWSAAFVERFAAFAGAAARLIRSESDAVPFYVPVNEISFMAWAGGDMGIFHPATRGRGEELKRQLARCAIEATHAIRAVDPRARFVQVEPAIRVVPDMTRPGSVAAARHHEDSQFHAWDMLAGRLAPELGGSEELLDVVGVNYYCHNQWRHGGGPIAWDGSDADYLPFSRLLAANHARYGRPILIAETGIEAELRPVWLRSVCDEVAVAMAAGVPVEGICLYPVMNHPGWDDERHCPNGLIDYDRASFRRHVHQPLADELARQHERFGLASPQLRRAGA
jgi:beta-glucosidase/6-phospho-beta-glucosidase/beta-galactosidase